MLRTLPARRDSPPECVFRLFCPGRSCTFYRGDCVICPSCERQQPQGRRQQTPPAHPGESAAWANLLYRRTAPQAFQHPFHARAISAAANRIRRRLPAPQTADTKVAGNYQPSKPKSSRFSAPVRVPAPTGALVFHVSISRHSPALLPSCRDRVFRGRMGVVLHNSILPEGNPSGLPHARRCASRISDVETTFFRWAWWAQGQKLQPQRFAARPPIFFHLSQRGQVGGICLFPPTCPR